MEDTKFGLRRFQVSYEIEDCLEAYLRHRHGKAFDRDMSIKWLQDVFGDQGMVHS